MDARTTGHVKNISAVPFHFIQKDGLWFFPLSQLVITSKKFKKSDKQPSLENQPSTVIIKNLANHANLPEKIKQHYYILAVNQAKPDEIEAKVTALKALGDLRHHTYKHEDAKETQIRKLQAAVLLYRQAILEIREYYPDPEKQAQAIQEALQGNNPLLNTVRENAIIIAEMSEEAITAIQTGNKGKFLEELKNKILAMTTSKLQQTDHYAEFMAQIEELKNKFAEVQQIQAGSQEKHMREMRALRDNLVTLNHEMKAAIVARDKDLKVLIGLADHQKNQLVTYLDKRKDQLKIDQQQSWKTWLAGGVTLTGAAGTGASTVGVLLYLGSIGNIFPLGLAINLSALMGLGMLYKSYANKQAIKKATLELQTLEDDLLDITQHYENEISKLETTADQTMREQQRPSSSNTGTILNLVRTSRSVNAKSSPTFTKSSTVNIPRLRLKPAKNSHNELLSPLACLFRQQAEHHRPLVVAKPVVRKPTRVN